MEVSLGQRVMSLVGLLAMIVIAWLVSKHRRVVPWRTIAWGLGLQLTFALLVLKTDAGRVAFGALNDAVITVLDVTARGTEFVFGAYANETFTIAINVLPTIVFFSSLMTILYYLGVMQRVVRGFAWLMTRTMRTSGPETLSVAANSFVGMTEAPLMVAPFIGSMTISELMAVMTGGFATVAGGVLAAYVLMLREAVPGIAGHLIAASVMSAPAALVVAKVMVPETAAPTDREGGPSLAIEHADVNVIDAAARGATDGLRLALNVGAMLLAFVALVALANEILGLPVELYNDWAGLEGGNALRPLTIQRILGWVFWPFAWLIGVPAAECSIVATLLGEKVVLTELIAYRHLSQELAAGTSNLSPRTVIIVSYALCGFANFGSVGIQLGGIGGIAPDRRHDLARLGLRAMFGGLLASLMTASVAGLLV